jgi:hypothetical protein
MISAKEFLLFSSHNALSFQPLWLLTDLFAAMVQGGFHAVYRNPFRKSNSRRWSLHAARNGSAVR